ncbi:hypothetical protein HAZT_HAZT007498 [Hyalella azteca]|uniref:EF-hand domain-containing protein n=1 Tax=Hyalella azteca TaxID=294128 RepID=A0A6A0H561_HYAAZ|nr:hypothetical protein HAZT_HAZT007498 [Hyalella azteca]
MPSLVKSSHPRPVTAHEIRLLTRGFKALDRDGSKKLSVSELMSLPGLDNNPLLHRIVDVLDTDGDGEIDIAEFIAGIPKLSMKGDTNSQLQFLFRIYDMDNDGFISSGELFQVLRMMDERWSDVQLQQMVDRTIVQHGTDGRISFDQFKAVVLASFHFEGSTE